jgi:hypothetical protein
MKHGAASFAFAGALCTVFVVASIIAVAELGQDACVDRGGAVADAGYACHLPEGPLVAVTSLVSGPAIVVVALGVAAPLLLLWFALRKRLGTRR